MRDIISARLWIGNALDARDPRRLYDAGVAAVVDLALEEPSAALPRDLAYCRFPLIDGSGNSRELLAASLETTATLIRRQIPTLVCCGAGMSRSPAVLAAALALVHGEPPERRLGELLAGAPRDVSPLFWREVCEAWQSMQPAS
jgi:protein-tyrosine phosphatase